MGRHALSGFPPTQPYALGVEILLWLAPSLVVLVAAMGWVTWLGRDRRGEVDKAVAAERLGRALAKEHHVRRVDHERVRDRSTGIAVRPTRRPDHTRHAS